MIKKYLISYAYTLGIIIGGTFLITVLNYFNIFTSNLTNIIKLIIVIVSMFIGAFLLGKRSLKKGYIEGIKYSIVFIVPVRNTGNATVAQLVEYDLAKVGVAGSNPVCRSERST